FYGRRFAGDTGRYQNSERDNLKYERDSYTDQDRFPSHDERHRSETDLSYDSRFDSYPRNNDRFHREERRHEIDRRRRVDHRDAGRYRHPHYDGSYEKPANYRERDDRNNSRMHNRTELRVEIIDGNRNTGTTKSIDKPRET
ncbi:Hypothetical predicted protein, partial [Paramuricea clavata]